MLGLWGIRPNNKRIGANALAKLKGLKIERVGVNKKKIRRVPSYGKYVATLLFIMHGLLDVSRFKRFLTLFLVILVHVLQFLDEISLL